MGEGVWEIWSGSSSSWSPAHNNNNYNSDRVSPIPISLAHYKTITAIDARQLRRAAGCGLCRQSNAKYRQSSWSLCSSGLDWDWLWDFSTYCLAGARTLRRCVVQLEHVAERGRVELIHGDRASCNSYPRLIYKKIKQFQAFLLSCGISVTAGGYGLNGSQGRFPTLVWFSHWNQFEIGAHN